MAKKLEKIYPWIVVGLLWVVALLNYMDRQMLSTMREFMAADIAQLNQAEAFGALMAIFLWIYAIVSPFAGTVADRVSRKWLIVGSLAVWSTVTLLMGYCTTFSQLKWLRGLMGVSEALYIPSGLSLIADYHTGKSRSLAVGIHMTGLYLGQALGGFGANLASALTWQQTFQGFGLIGIAYAVLLVFCLKETRPAKSSLDASSVISTKAEGRVEKSILKSFALIFSNIAFWAILFYFAASSMPGWATKNWLPTLFQGSLDIPMEKAFKEHMQWDPIKGAPYVSVADEELIDQIAQDDMVRGYTISCGGFYGPQGRVLRADIADPKQNEKIESFEYDGMKICNFEMESSALAGLASLLGHRAMTCCMVIANRYAKQMNTEYKNSIDTLIEKVLDRI